jgi:hypothetical protein
VHLLQIATADNGSLKLSEKAAPFPGGGSDFGRIAISADGRYVAFTNEHGGVRVADIERGRMVALVPHPAGAVAFTREHRLLASGMDGRIVEWDASGQALLSVRHSEAVRAIALSPDSRRLAAASDGGLLHILDTRDGSESAPLRLEGGEIHLLAFSPDGKWLAGAVDQTLWLVDTAGWRAMGPFPHADQLASVAFAPDGKRIATTTPGGDLRVWIERQNASRLLRVWDIASRSELAAMSVIAKSPRRDESVVGAPGQTEDSKAEKAISTGDAALASQAVSWPRVSRALKIPSHPWLSAKTALEVAGQSHGDSAQFAFGADGRLLASAFERDVRLWHLKAEDLIADICARLPAVKECGK